MADAFVGVGGTEVVVLLLVVALVGVMAGAVVLSVDQARRELEDERVVLKAEPEQVGRSLVLDTSGSRDLSITPITPTLMTFTRQVRPAWIYPVAAVFFPVGLVALLVKTSRTGSASIEPHPTGSILHLRGRFDRDRVERINRTIRRHR